MGACRRKDTKNAATINDMLEMKDSTTESNSFWILDVVSPRSDSLALTLHPEAYVRIRR